MFKIFSLLMCQPNINIKSDLSIHCWKKQTIPGRTEAQMKAARAKCATLFRKYGDREWIIDDEFYLTLSHSSINGNDNYYSNNKDLASA